MSRHNPRTILGVFLILAFTTFTLAGSAFAQTESTLYNFTGGSDGGAPYGGRLIFDPSGNLYGIAIFGGINDNGVIYELSPAAGGGWTQTVLYSFLGGSDGSNPEVRWFSIRWEIFTAGRTTAVRMGRAQFSNYRQSPVAAGRRKFSTILLAALTEPMPMGV